jgi:hypothetical protein
MVATVNRPVIDRGFFPSTKNHGQEGADRDGYPLAENRQAADPKNGSGATCWFVGLMRYLLPPKALWGFVSESHSLGGVSVL